MRTILLVEDDPFLVDIYSTKLKEAGFSVEVTQDGEEALRKIKETGFDLVLLDIVLPTVNGWEILRNIKRDPSLKELKVVVLSNLGEKKRLKRVWRRGLLGIW